MQWQDAADINVTTRSFWEYSGGPPTATDCVALAADLYALVAAHNALWDTETFLSGVKVTDLSSSSGGVGEHASSTVGTTDFAFSAATCALINFVITRRYRGGKPRWYLPWGGGGDLTSKQEWTATFITNTTTAVAAIRTGFIGSTSGSTAVSNQCSVSYYAGFTAVENPITHRWRNVPNLRTTPEVNVIESFSVNGLVSSQRRRNRSA
jgi:hypothetical protein